MEFAVDPYALMALNSRDAFSGIRMEIANTEADWETDEQCFDLCLNDMWSEYKDEFDGISDEQWSICNQRCFQQ